MDLRLRSNEASRPVARKPSGRRLFCLWASLAQSLQPAAGMLGLRRLAHSQNPSPQHPSQFSVRLLTELLKNATEAFDPDRDVRVLRAAEADAHLTIGLPPRGIIAIAKLAGHVEHVAFQRGLKQ